MSFDAVYMTGNRFRRSSVVCLIGVLQLSIHTQEARAYDFVSTPPPRSAARRFASTVLEFMKYENFQLPRRLAPHNPLLDTLIRMNDRRAMYDDAARLLSPMTQTPEIMALFPKTWRSEGPGYSFDVEIFNLKGEAAQLDVIEHLLKAQHMAAPLVERWMQAEIDKTRAESGSDPKGWQDLNARLAPYGVYSIKADGMCRQVKAVASILAIASDMLRATAIKQAARIDATAGSTRSLDKIHRKLAMDKTIAVDIARLTAPALIDNRPESARALAAYLALGAIGRDDDRQLAAELYSRALNRGELAPAIIGFSRPNQQFDEVPLINVDAIYHDSSQAEGTEVWVEARFTHPVPDIGRYHLHQPSVHAVASMKNHLPVLAPENLTASLDSAWSRRVALGIGNFRFEDKWWLLPAGIFPIVLNAVVFMDSKLGMATLILPIALCMAFAGFNLYQRGGAMRVHRYIRGALETPH